MLFPVMCHLLYIDTTIFTKISDYAIAVFSVHSMMRPLKFLYQINFYNLYILKRIIQDRMAAIEVIAAQTELLPPIKFTPFDGNEPL